MPKIAAILPSYNEEISIGSMVLSCKKHVEEVLVIDDGSLDRTAEIAEAAGARVIKHHHNKGKGAALKTGFEALRNFDIVVTMDADGQHNPEEIPKLVEPIIRGEADLVNGSRYLRGTDGHTPKFRRVGQTVLDKATNISGKFNITDTQSGFRAFASNIIPVFRFSGSGFGIESEMLVDAAEAGLKIMEVEIGVRYDVEGSTKNPISHGISVLLKNIQDMEFNRPLYYFTLPGAVLIIIGIGLGLIFLRDYLAGTSISLAPTILAIMLTLAGTFVAFTGIILDSMSRMIKRAIRK
jgi:glycosyltransferase involved in cell wall biosynthesis